MTRTYPVLVRLFDTYLPYGNSNPDCTYFHATVSPQHTYRISGRRGTARIVEVQIMDGHFVAGPAHKSLLTLPDVQADGDGQPRNRPERDAATRKLGAARSGRALALPAAVLLRLGRTKSRPTWSSSGSAPSIRRPLPSPEDIARRVDRLIAWIPTWYRHLERRIETLLRRARRSLPLHLVVGRDGRPALRQGPFQLRARPGRRSSSSARPSAGTGPSR